MHKGGARRPALSEPVCFRDCQPNVSITSIKRKRAQKALTGIGRDGFHIDTTQ
jgi:hypothetical protein